MSLKQKTVSGLIWSFIENFSRQGILFVIGIILARLLTPKDFGLIGMTTIFISFSQTFIDSGFGQALVRKKNCNQADYSTVFFYNLFVGTIFWGILFLSAGLLSDFFNEPKLELIIQVLGVGLIINSLTLIHQIILIKRIDFKLQTKISVLASVGSGIIGIFMAYQGYGVWSLVVKTLLGYAFTSLLFWTWNSWKPSLIFSWKSFNELFSFGSKLLFSGLIRRAYENIYLLVIGKFFSAAELGFYTRANQFKNLSSNNISVVIQRVSYPALASIQDDVVRLKSAYRRLIKSTMLVTFFLMIGLAVVAESLILFLIGEKWLPSVILLQLLSFVGVFFPWQEINLNILKVLGRSDLILKLELITKFFVVPVVIIGIYFGINSLIIGMILASFISYLIISYFAGVQIGYNTLQQIKDILPAFLLISFSGVIVFLAASLINIKPLFELALQTSVYTLLVFGLCELFKLDEYLYIKQLVKEKLPIRKTKKDK